MIPLTDYRVFRLINGFAGTARWLDVTMVLLAEYASLLFVATLLWLWVAPSRGPQKLQDRLAVGRALAAAELALGLGQIIGWGFPRPRPFQDHMVRLLIARSSDPSFPSDHVLAAFAIAAALATSHPRLSLSLLSLATLLGVGRVFVGIHYPLDVLGGAILGGVMGAVSHKADGWLIPVIRYADGVWQKMVAPRKRP